MRFAKFNGKRIEATPGAKGVCPNCESELIARCGEYNVWHWAHKVRPDCDSWSEPETWWHRDWKNRFPLEWQEISHTDSTTGEKHIADIKTPLGLVIEFQHSPIQPDEREARERFYQQMYWIVDGRRAPTDIDNFKNGISRIDHKKPLYKVKWKGQSRLLDNWGKSGTYVYIDFGDHLLWRLLKFDSSVRLGIVMPYNKNSLFKYIRKTTDDFYYEQANNGIINILSGISIGPYALGMPKTEVWKQFRYPITCFFKSEEATYRSDSITHFGIDIHYDGQEKCNLIEAWTQMGNNTIVRVLDTTLNGMTMRDVKTLCDRLPYNFEKKFFGFESIDKRIGFYCHEYESEDSLLNGVYVMHPKKTKS
jgi:competence protein CoiA